MARRTRTESSDLEIAALVQRFVETLRQYVDGAIAASEMADFARTLWLEASGEGSPFPGNGPASVAFDSIWRPADGELRMTDVQGYIRWLTVGAGSFPGRVCGVRVSAAELARRLSLPTQRYILDGLGWVESVEFASPITGRQFHAESSMMPGVPDNVFVRVSEERGDPPPFLDLCNTLAIDAADCFIEHDAIPRWQIWRQDDNGHRAVVASFTALLKARRELSRLEQSSHKQMYWLEEVPSEATG